MYLKETILFHSLHIFYSCLILFDKSLFEHQKAFLFLLQRFRLLLFPPRLDVKVFIAFLPCDVVSSITSLGINSLNAVIPFSHIYIKIVCIVF